MIVRLKFLIGIIFIFLPFFTFRSHFHDSDMSITRRSEKFYQLISHADLLMIFFHSQSKLFWSVSINTSPRTSYYKNRHGCLYLIVDVYLDLAVISVPESMIKETILILKKSILPNLEAINQLHLHTGYTNVPFSSHSVFIQELAGATCTRTL